MTASPPLPSAAPQSATLLVARLSADRRWMVWGIALLFTAYAVHWSMRNGRLAQDPTFDDVGYFIEGAQRQAVLDEHGLAGLVKDYVQNPPHTAFSSLLALASFELLGINDWAPYAFNGFVVAAFLFFCCRIFGDLRPAGFYSLLLFCLTIPLALRAVHDFRPDFMVALTTGAFVWFGLAAVAGPAEHEARHAMIAGTLLGAALWIKPTVFAHTLAIAIVVGTCIAGSRWFPGLGQRDFRRSLWTALRFGGTGVALGAPYYVVNGRQTIEYFVVNTRGEDAHIANFRGSVWKVFRAFVWDGAQTFTMGRYLWLLLGICVVGLVWAAYGRRARLLFHTAGLLLAAAASLSIFVYGRHNNEYFGLFYQILVLFAALTPLAAIMRLHPAALAAGPVLLLLSLNSFFFSPLGLFWVPMLEAHPLYGWNRMLVEAMARDADFRRNEIRSNVSPLPVFVSFAGAVSSPSMQWDCIKERLPFVFSDFHRSGDVESQLKMARQAAYVVVATPTAQSLYSLLPSAGVEDVVLASVQRDANFREVKVDADTLPPYRLFRNLRIVGKSGSRNAVAIGWPYTGLLPIEGPYLNLDLPEVRWGTFPGSTITVNLPVAAAGTLRFTVSAQPGTVIRVRLNDASLGEHVQKSTSHEAAEFPLLLHAGGNVVALDYEVPGIEPTLGTRAVLFSRIEIATSSTADQ